MAAQTPSSYLDWLAQLASPPFPLVLPAAQSAGETLLRRTARALERFLTTPTADHYWSFADLFQQSTTLSGWMEATAPFSPEVDLETCQRLLDRWEVRLDQLQKRLIVEGRGAVNQLLRRRDCTPTLRRLLKEEIDGLPPEAAAVRRVQQLGRAYERRMDAQDQATDGLWLPEHTPLSFVSAVERTQAQAIAQSQGTPGYIFTTHSMGLQQILTFAPRAELRRQAWLHSQATTHRPQQVEAMRVARQAMTPAKTPNVIRELQKYSVVKRSSAMEALLVRSVQGLRNARRQFERTAWTYGQRRSKRHALPAESERWDMEHRLSRLPFKRQEDLPEGSFPWLSTVLTALPELLAIGGWQLRARPHVRGRGVRVVVQFQLHHPELGRRAEVWYSPFNPRPAQQGFAGAFMQSIAAAWSLEGAAAPVLWLAQNLSAPEQAFTRFVELDSLAHEVGHILHYLALPGATPMEDVSLPNDIIELPAHLLAAYVRDPRVLARWAAQSGPAKARRPRHWLPYLKYGVEHALDTHDHLINGLTDYSAHLHSPAQHTYQSLRERINALAGTSQNAAHQEFWGGFIWEREFAGQWHYQAVGDALAHRLLRMTPNGQTDAHVVAQRYRELLSRVLASGTLPDRFIRAWHDWLGESVHTSLQKGFQALVQQQRRIFQQHTQRLQESL